MNLSKSRYCESVQCPKMLWMRAHRPELYDKSVMNQSILDTGKYVGDVAKRYYGDYIEIPIDHENMAGMVEQTKSLIEVKTPIITEATFSYDGNLCLVDILKLDDDGVDIVEVKSSTSMKDIYYHDIAYQMWVVTHSGLKVKSVSLMHINNEYVRYGDLDLQELFAVEDHTNDAIGMQDEVSVLVPELKRIASQEEEPECRIGLHCFDPYECGYRGYCWQDMPSPNVFDIGGIDPKKAVNF